MVNNDHRDPELVNGTLSNRAGGSGAPPVRMRRVMAGGVIVEPTGPGPPPDPDQGERQNESSHQPRVHHTYFFCFVVVLVLTVLILHLYSRVLYLEHKVTALASYAVDHNYAAFNRLDWQ